MTKSDKDLHILTEKLPNSPTEFPAPVRVNLSERATVLIHPLPCGTGLSWNLLSQKEVGVARWFFSSGSVFPKHHHDEVECLIVYFGQINLHFTESGNDVVLGAGAVINIDAGVEHSAEMLTDTWCIAITMPRSPDWPDGESTKVKHDE